MKILSTYIAPLVLTALLALSVPASAEQAPAFLEVGKSYVLMGPAIVNQQQFKVLEIGQNGWVKVAMQEGIKWCG